MSRCRKEVSVPPDDDADTNAVQLFKCYFADACSQTASFDTYLRTRNTNKKPPTKYQRIRGTTITLAAKTTTPWRDHYKAQWLTMNRNWKGEVTLPEERHLAPPPAPLLPPPSICDSVQHWLSMQSMTRPRMLTLLPGTRCWRSYVQRSHRRSVLCGTAIAR